MSPEQAEHTELAEAAVAGEDSLKSWTWFGYKAADFVATSLLSSIGRVTGMVGTSVNDADYLRASIGNAWLLMPILGLAFGVVATVNAMGLPLPPATWIFVVLVVLGCLDASAGLLATTVVLIGTVVTGHFTTLHAVSGIFGLGVMWFGAAKLAHSFRPIRTWDHEPTTALRAWRIGGDIIILPIAGAFLMSKLVQVFNYLTGYQVPIRNEGTLVLIVAFAALAIRAILQSLVVNNYRNRLASMPGSEATPRYLVANIIGLLVRAFVAYAVIWSFLGNSIQTWIVLVLFVSSEPISYVGARYFPEKTIIYRLVPRNLLKLAFVVLFAELLILWLSPHYHSTQQLMGWTFVGLGVFLVVILIFERFRGEDWPERWATRILGALSILFFVLVIQGWVTIG